MFFLFVCFLVFLPRRCSFVKKITSSKLINQKTFPIFKIQDFTKKVVANQIRNEVAWWRMTVKFKKIKLDNTYANKSTNN